MVAVGHAAADTRETLTEVPLRKKPGESQAVVATYARGTQVTVLETQGRWVRVRAGDSTGWVPRTKLSTATAPAPDGPAAAAPIPRSTRLTVTVRTADASLRAGPDASAAVVAPVAVGAVLEVIDAHEPGWLHVADRAGHDGWIEATRLGNASADPDALRPAPARPGPARAIAPPPRLAVRAAASIGYRSLDERFTSNATGGLADYLISTDASVADLGAELVVRPRPAIVVGLDGRVRVSASTPGIDYPGPTLAPGQIPFTLFEAGAGARAGVHRGALDLAVRVGGHYGAFLADEVDNAGRMPRERLLGATVGARFELRPARTRFGVAAGGDYLVVGDRRQTAGLADGETSDAGALWLDMRVDYQLRPWLAVFGAFAYERATTRWQGMSQRWADVTEAERVDAGQIISLGLGTRL